MHNDHHHDQRHDGKRKSDRKSGRGAGDADAARAGECDLDEAFYLSIFRDAPYFSSGRNWRDYAPAYRYGHAARAGRGAQRFEDVEAELARDWDKMRADSRLLWAEARYAVRDAWQHVDADLRNRRRDD
jgi:hypothetical protein